MSFVFKNHLHPKAIIIDCEKTTQLLCREEIKPIKRRKPLEKDKCYVRVFKQKNKRLINITFCIGIDILKLLEINPVARINIYSIKENNNLIEIEYDDKRDDGYKLIHKKETNYSFFTFPHQNFMNLPLFDTREINFNFTDKPSLIFDLSELKL